jgi:hypothetical protein
MISSPKHLLVAATLAVMALAWLSNPSPATATDLSSAAGAGHATQVVCMVMDLQERENGWTLTLADGKGAQAQAYFSKSMAARPPNEGQVLRFTLMPSDRASFFFVEAMAAV